MEVVAPLAPPPQAQVRESAFLKKRRYKMKKRSILAWRRTIFIVAILITSLSLVLAACAPADLSGNAGNKKDAATNTPKHDNPTNAPKADNPTNPPKADNPTNTPKSNNNGSGGGVRGTNSGTPDPCLDAGQLPCGQGDHGKGNPVNGSAHANCRAAQGEVDPVCTPKNIPTPPGKPTPPPGNPTPPPGKPTPPPPPITEVKSAPPVAESCPNWIMFHTFRTGDLEIFRLDGIEGKDGVKPIDLSNSNSTDSRPSRSPDSNSVVFQSNRNGNLELYLTDSEGKSQTRLTNTKANNINSMFSPDDQSVIYQSDRNGNWDIFLLNKDTGKELQLTSDGGDDVNPFWSPDKNWITFQSNRTGSWNVYLLDLSSDTEYQVTSFSQDVLFPSWSPNGKELAFFINTSGTWDLYVSDLQGKSFKQISIGGDAGNASWAPQGDRIAYQVTTRDNSDVYTYDLVTNTEYQLTDFAGVDSAPTWNCIGTDVSFTTNRDGNPNIYSTWWQGGSDTYQITNSPSTDKWSE